jgi:hypothetical protein
LKVGGSPVRRKDIIDMVMLPVALLLCNLPLSLLKATSGEKNRMIGHSLTREHGMGRMALGPKSHLLTVRHSTVHAENIGGTVHATLGSYMG